MKTIQITIDSVLLERIDKKCESRNRSAFFRQAAETLLKQLKIKELEERDRAGYKKQPVAGEFDLWSDEQVWADESW